MDLYTLLDSADAPKARFYMETAEHLVEEGKKKGQNASYVEGLLLNVKGTQLRKQKRYREAKELYTQEYEISQDAQGKSIALQSLMHLSVEIEDFASAYRYAEEYN